MAFTGVDYHAAFEEACGKLPYVTDADDVRSELEGIEWILWEAIRGVFFYAAVGVACVLVFVPSYLIGVERGWVSGLILTGVTIVIAVAIYWFLRMIFYFEISKHVKGRRFGSGGLDR